MEQHLAKSLPSRLDAWRNKAEGFLEKHKSVKECLDAFADQTNGPITRAFALGSVLIHISGLHKPMQSALKRDYNFKDAPINPDLYEFKERVGYGYWSEAYLLEPKRDDLPILVYKVEYPATKKRTEELIATTKRYRQEYEFLKDAYKDMPGLIPETQYMIVKSPRSGKPAIGALQTFVGTGAFDLLYRKNEQRVKELLRSDPKFKKQFEDFSRITLELAKSNSAPDLAGRDNVFVVKTGETHAIRVVDHHGFPTENVQAQRVHELNIQYLRNLQ